MYITCTTGERLRLRSKPRASTISANGVCGCSNAALAPAV
jgi:hypothetical protein